MILYWQINQDICGGIMQKTTRDFDLDELLGFELLYAIKRGLKDEDGYPFASMYGNPQYVCITLDTSGEGLKEYQLESLIKQMERFQKLVQLFPQLCQKYDVKPLAGHESVARVRMPIEHLVKFEFLIDPVEFDRMMMMESHHYCGYRHSGSILRLAFPNSEALKAGVMCLFPVLPTSENTVMLRIAGCNASETITTQLSYLVNKLNLLEYEAKATDFYGHHSTPIVDDLFAGLCSFDFLSIALRCIGINGDINHQSEHGFTEFELSATVMQNCVREMDETANSIYRLLGVVSAQELANLQSVEVPMIDFVRGMCDFYRERIADAYQTIGEHHNRRCESSLSRSKVDIAQRVVDECLIGLRQAERVLARVQPTHGIGANPLAPRLHAPVRQVESLQVESDELHSGIDWQNG